MRDFAVIAVIAVWANYCQGWASYFEFAANQSLSDREITYLLRDIDRKRDTADMRSEAKHREEREETEKKTRKQRKGFP